MNAPPLLFGGCSPVVAYLRHSIIVYSLLNNIARYLTGLLTVLPDPFNPTMSVSGA